jgi:hypothetical protein
MTRKDRLKYEQECRAYQEEMVDYKTDLERAAWERDLQERLNGGRKLRLTRVRKSNGAIVMPEAEQVTEGAPGAGGGKRRRGAQGGC